MKKTPLIIAFSSLALLTACGGRTESAQTDADSAVQTALADGPRSADGDLQRESSATLGGHQYTISIHRYADKSLSTVKDELGQEFYDNSVEIKIQRDGSNFYSKTFTKEAFLNHLSASDRTSTILLGMAFDAERSEANTLCFGAQIGQPGIESGPAFTVLIPTNGSAVSILRDTVQDTSGSEPEGD